MSIPKSIVLEDVEGNKVPMTVIGTGDVDHAGERRTYLALIPEEQHEADEEAVALVVRWAGTEGIFAIEDDNEFQAALDALEMDEQESQESSGR